MRGGTHSAHAALAFLSAYSPALHISHPAASERARRPAGQAVHALALASDAKPDWHGEQVRLPSVGAAFPGSHTSQRGDAAARAEVPDGQAVHDDAPLVEVVPASHAAHDVEPLVLALRPAGHAEQLEPALPTPMPSKSSESSVT